MTKKDYELIAHSLNAAWTNAKTSEERIGVKLARDNMLANLQNDNARFNTIKFLEACGTQHGQWVCPSYNNQSALPDEDNNCSLCGAAMVKGYPETIAND